MCNTKALVYEPLFSGFIVPVRFPNQLLPELGLLGNPHPEHVMGRRSRIDLVPAPLI